MQYNNDFLKTDGDLTVFRPFLGSEDNVIMPSMNYNQVSSNVSLTMCFLLMTTNLMLKYLFHIVDIP